MESSEVRQRKPLEKCDSIPTDEIIHGTDESPTKEEGENFWINPHADGIWNLRRCNFNNAILARILGILKHFSSSA